MIIELAGVPGGGKSTTSRRLLEAYPGRVHVSAIDMYNRGPLAWYASLFLLRHPLSFFWTVSFVLRHHARGLLKYSLHLALRACAKYQKASFHKKDAVVLIDEGVVHLLCVLPVSSLTESEVNMWTRRFVLPDAVALATEGSFHRFQPTADVIHPRVQQGEEALSKWKQSVTRNAESVRDALGTMSMEEVDAFVRERIGRKGS